MHYEQLIGVSFGLQVTNTLYELGLHVAGLEAVSHQCPPHYRTLTGFHIHRVKTQMSTLTQEVHRMLRHSAECRRSESAECDAAAAAAASRCDTAGGTGNDSSTIVFCTMVMKEV